MLDGSLEELIVKLAEIVSATLILAGAASAQTLSPAQKMAATAIQQWPAGNVSTTGAPGKWGYEEGVLLDGMAAEWHATGNGEDFVYIKAAVDKYVTPEGTITGYKADAHTLDDIELGRAVLVVYRATLLPRYALAAKFLHDQLAVQPRTASGGYWHKQVYPNQMWLDGAYMAEPFRAMYAASFQQPQDFDDIARQLLLMDTHMRDPKTGLLRHGWDESKSMPWADKTTGLSPEAWGRAMGWYCMALVDVLDWFPKDHPQRPALIAALYRNLGAVLTFQDGQTGLWRQVMDGGDWMDARQQPAVMHQPKDGDFFEASASCMFVYTLAKAERMGYVHYGPITQRDTFGARKGWAGIQKQFVTTNPDGTLTLHGTVKVGGLGGKPYRAGDYNYYIGEKVVDQDAKGVGALLLAWSEMDQLDPFQQASAARHSANPPTAIVDAWFNSQTRKNPLGQTETFHYKWDDDSYNGYSLFGRAFERHGATLATLPAAPTRANLAQAQIYIIASPDIPSKNPNPHYMDQSSGDAVEAWVKSGGVLLLFSNDRDNTEFTHFDTLADRFGIHFNPVLSHHVVDPDHSTGEVVIPPGTGIFGAGFTAYMKDTCTITPSGPAKALVTDHGDVTIAIAHVGKGVVLGVVDPWFYNEYADGRKMVQYKGFEAADDIAAWAVRQAQGGR
jgi:unsaturated rhamnogalacturonyl hydrolase